MPVVCCWSVSTAWGTSEDGEAQLGEGAEEVGGRAIEQGRAKEVREGAGLSGLSTNNVACG